MTLRRLTIFTVAYAVVWVWINLNPFAIFFSGLALQ